MERESPHPDYYHGSSDYPNSGKKEKLGHNKFVPLEDITEEHLPEGWGTKSPEELFAEEEEARREHASEYADDMGGKIGDSSETKDDEGGVISKAGKVGIRRMASKDLGMFSKSVGTKREFDSKNRGKSQRGKR